MKAQKYIFYCEKPSEINSVVKSLPKGYSFKIWTPKIYRIAPRGLHKKAFFIYWFLYYLGFFVKRDYKIFTVYCDKKKELAHYSVILPKFFRTRFMGKEDLQIGPIGTNSKHRRKGLANYTIGRILEFYREKDFNFWYVVRKENKISRHVIEKIGFQKYGEGFKRKKIFRTFIIDKRY